MAEAQVLGREHRKDVDRSEIEKLDNVADEDTAFERSGLDSHDCLLWM